MPTFKILDGGLGTTLAQMGYEQIDHDELWSARLLATNLDALFQAHEKFVLAGSNYVASATYQMPSDQQTDATLAEKIGQNSKIVHKKLTEKCPSITHLGSLGSYGAGLHDGSEYTGSFLDVNSSEAQAEIERKIRYYHEYRIKIITCQNCDSEKAFDILAFETIPALAEVKIILNLMKNYPKIRYYISSQCNYSGLSHGEKFDQLVDLIESESQNSPNLIGYGVNCVRKSVVEPFLQEIQKYRASHTNHKNLTIFLYPNVGQTWNGQTHTWEDLDQTDTSKHWLDVVKTFDFDFVIGGCCGTGPEGIQALAEKVRSL